jgi:uncharacterized membrane protein
LPEALASLAGALHYLPPLVLLWLAFFFGRTLRAGQTPLIERIARQGNPDMPPALRRYTRWLTAIWCAYFVIAAALTATASLGYAATSLVVWSGTIVLFVGERMIRPWLFPGEVFPGLLQQIRDTWSAWRPHR